MIKLYRVFEFINDERIDNPLFTSYSFNKSIEFMNNCNNKSRSSLSMADEIEYKVLEFEMPYMLFHLTQTSHDHKDDKIVKITDLQDLLDLIEACEEEVIIYKEEPTFGTGDIGYSPKDSWVIEIYDDYRE